MSAIPAIGAHCALTPPPPPFHPIPPHSHPRSPHFTPGLIPMSPHLTPFSSHRLRDQAEGHNPNWFFNYQITHLPNVDLPLPPTPYVHPFPPKVTQSTQG